MQSFTDWEPTSDWLIVEPHILPEQTSGKIIVPEQLRKTNSGIVKRVGHEGYRDWVGKEVFWPMHAETEVIDSETSLRFILIKTEAVMMFRNAKQQSKFYKVSN